MTNNEQRESVLYIAASKLLEVSKLLADHHPILSNLILLMSESIVADVMKSRKLNQETDPSKSKRLNEDNVAKIREELGGMIEETKKELEEEGDI